MFEVGVLYGIEGVAESPNIPLSAVRLKEVRGIRLISWFHLVSRLGRVRQNIGEDSIWVVVVVQDSVVHKFDVLDSVNPRSQL